MASIISVLFFLASFLLAPLPLQSADSDPLQDFCVGLINAPESVNGFPCKPVSEVTADDFSSRVIAHEGNTNNAFRSNVTGANAMAFPGLNTLGVSMNRIDLAPGGLNPPHSHPRATQLDIVIEGTVMIGFVTTGNVFYSKVLRKGELFVVPRGLVHFEKNIGKGKALIFAAFNGQMPGTVSIAPTLFGAKPSIPDAILSTAFQVETGVVDEIKSKFSC
ncbi:hypothetical protein Nepgr_023810 [Nepenthes gracilis]|uniref:Germin-like protein n=1 Tax=Nepenthes gracilis TaxID=150966 RepID=A0AAD3T3C0_NEPGR|nr:hypothetical protein Nepgr_023810 [Nepenthes gracilis]